MRIFHLVSYPLYSGPLPPTLGLAVAQRLLGHTVWLAYDRKRGNFDGYEEDAEDAVRDSELRSPLELTLSTKSSPLELIADVRALRRFVRDGGVDVLHLHLSHDHALSALIPTRGARVRRVRTIHAGRSLTPRLGQRWLTRKADGWIVRSESHRSRLITASGVDPSRVVAIASGVDALRFRPATPEQRRAARRELGLPEQARVLGHVALMAGRGQEELVAAVRELQRDELHVILVGAGEREAALRELVAAARLRERVHFLGYCKGEQLNRAYAAMDAAFLAQAGNDASARAALEAMASSLPVLAVQEEALGEVVTRDVGFPIGRRSVPAVRDAIASWLEDVAEGSRRGASGRRYVEAERTFAREAEATLALYERVRQI